MNRIVLLLIVPITMIAALDTRAGGKPRVLQGRDAPPPVLHPLRTAQLGTWDDVTTFADVDFMLLRRGRELFSLLPGRSHRPRKLVTLHQSTETRIFAYLAWRRHQWLFCDAPDAGPFLVDLTARRELTLPIAGLRVRAGHAPRILTVASSGTGESAVVQVGCGDTDGWPKDRGRPLYFWTDLDTGNLSALPAAWELQYFSADRNLVVFWAPPDDPSGPGTLHTVEMSTGHAVRREPYRTRTTWAPLDARSAGSVMPFFTTPGSGDAYRLAGLSVRGALFPLVVDADRIPCGVEAKVAGEWATLYVKSQGIASRFSHSLWIAPLARGARAIHVADDVSAFEPLGGGRCFFVKAGHAPRGKAMEGFVYDAHTRRARNVLDGVQRLAPLPAALAHKSYIADELTAKVIPAFGGRAAGRPVLCLFSQRREDRRAIVPFSHAETIRPQRWSVAMLTQPDGSRRIVELPESTSRERSVWLCHSGQVILGDAVFAGEGPSRSRKIRLSVLDLSR